MPALKSLMIHLCHPPVPTCATCARKDEEMGLANLKEKYDPLKAKVENEPQITTENGAVDSGPPQPASPKVEEAANLQSWKDSAPVIRLSEYLKKHKDQGITLYQSNGWLALVFDPGLSRDDFKSERGQIARNASSLLIDATDDLKYLIDNGLIDIPIRAGPSWASELYGSQTRK